MGGGGWVQRSTSSPSGWLPRGIRRRTLCLVRLAIAQVARLLIRVDVPHDVVGQTDDLVAGTLRHLGESFGLGLVLKRVRGEIDTGPVNVGLDEDVDATNAVKLDLLVLVLPPVTHADQICAAGVVLLVAFGEDGIGVKGGTEAAGLLGVNPRVVIDYRTG